MMEDYPSPMCISASTTEMKIQPRLFRYYQSPHSKKQHRCTHGPNAKSNHHRVCRYWTHFTTWRVKLLIALGAPDGGGAQAAEQILFTLEPPSARIYSLNQTVRGSSVVLGGASLSGAPCCLMLYMQPDHVMVADMGLATLNNVHVTHSTQCLMTRSIFVSSDMTDYWLSATA
ncbi:hypothetical protein BDR03DRAFT_633548 [Suillus americanus]|nr:hypothetical protein BDR03DRAFT_633548 [Suillus americanus]